MDDLQTYRARIGLFRHRLASKRNVPPHKRASCRKREQKRRQDKTKLKKSCGGSAIKLNPVASSGKMASGITRRFAIIVIAILLMAGLTSGHMDTDQFFTENELYTDFPESHVIGKCFTLTLQQNYVIPSSMGDCLLGNAGVHAYNGNPRTPVSNDDRDMDWEANADTPSEGQLQPFLEVGGDERSTGTKYQSQRADQIQKLDIDIRKQYADMITKLHGYISPMLSETWELFRNGLTPHLTRRETHGSDVTFVGHICESLLRTGVIKHGEYSILFESVNCIDVRAGEIVERATTAIKDIKMKISALQSEARSDHNTHREEYPFSELGQSYGLLKASSRPNERAMDGFKRENIITRSDHNTHREEYPFSELGQSYGLLKASSRPNERAMDGFKRENIINQTEIWIKSKRKQTTYITTNALNVAIDILKKTNLLLIKGKCGDGKSVLAMEIMAWLMGDREEQCGQVQHDTVNPRKKPLLLKELKSWDEIISCHANLAIFIDDLFGYRSIYSEDLAWWKKISPFIRPVLDGQIGNNANCMILTVRDDVYAEHRSLFCDKDVFTECLVDFSSAQSLQTEEKKNILRLYMPAGVELSTDDNEVVNQLLSNSLFKSTLVAALGITDIHDQIKSLENRIGDMEQYSRRTCLKFRGLPESEGEDTDTLVLDLINHKLGVMVELHDIGRSHRTGPPSPGRPRDIIVRFLSYRTRAAVYDARSQLWHKDSDLSKTSDGAGHPGIYINEALTKQRAIVFAKARHLKKSGLIQGTWTRDGTIIIRDTHGAYTQVTSLEELSAYPDPPTRPNKPSTYTRARTTLQDKPKISPKPSHTRSATPFRESIPQRSASGDNIYRKQGKRQQHMNMFAALSPDPQCSDSNTQ